MSSNMRDWLDNLADNYRELEIDGKIITFRLPEPEALSAIRAHVYGDAERVKNGESSVQDGADWQAKWFGMCLAATVNTTNDIRERSPDEWLRAAAALIRDDGGEESPMLAMALRICGFKAEADGESKTKDKIDEAMEGAETQS